MPTYSIQAPNGRTYDIEGPEGASQDEVIRQVLSQHPDAATPTPQGTGLMGAAKNTVNSAINEYRTGLGALTGNTSAAAKAGAERAKAIEAANDSGMDASKITAYADSGDYIGMLKEAARQSPAALVHIAPMLAEIAGGARLGAMAGTAVAPGPGTAVGAILGGAASQIPRLTGAKLQEKAATQQEAGQPVDVSLLPAVGSAAFDALLNVGAVELGIPGLANKLMGKTAAELTQSQLAAAEKIAQRGMLKSAAAGVGKMAVAMPAVVEAQTAANRAYLEKPLTGDEAMKEYKNALYGTLPLAPLGAYGGVAARGHAREAVGRNAEQQRNVDRQFNTAGEPPAPEPGGPTVEGGLFPAAPVPEKPETNLLEQPVQREAAAELPSGADIADQHADYRRKIDNLTSALDEQRNNAAVAAQAGDIDIAQEETAKFRTMEKALKDMEAEAKQLPPAPKAELSGDALDKSLADAKKKLALAGEQGDIDAIEQQTKRIKKLQAANPDLFTKAHEQAIRAGETALGQEMGAGREAEAARRARVEQEAAGIRGLAEKAEQPEYAGEARKERQTQLEINEIEKGRMDTGVTEQGALFPEETGAGVRPAAETAQAQRDRLVLQLQEALRQRKDDPQKYRPVVDDLLEQLRALKEKPALAPQPRGAETAEMAPELAGTKMPETLPPSAAGAPVERTITPETTSEKALQAMVTQAATLRQATPEQKALLGRVQDNLKAVAASPERRGDVAKLAHQIRIGQDTTDSAARVQEHLQALEAAKRSEAEETPNWHAPLKNRTAIQENAFPDTELQGHIFDTPEGFQRYLASEGLNETRKAVGLALQTMARARKIVAPLEAQAAELRESIANLQTMLAATKSTGAEKIGRAQEAHDKALARVRELERAVDEKLKPAQAAYIEASLQLSKAQAARAKVAGAIAKNQTKFSPDASVHAAADASAKAQARYRDGLAHGGHTKEHMDGLAAAAKAAEAAHRTALARAANPLDRSVLAYLNKDVELQLRLADAEQTLETSKSQLDGARAALEAVDREVKGSIAYQAEHNVNKRAEAHARGVLTKARGATEHTVAKTTAEIAARNTDLNDTNKQIRGELEPVEKAQAERTQPAAETETQAQREARDAEQRKADNASTERLGALPGVTVSHEDFRKALDKLELLPDKIRAADARAKDETLPTTTRNKAKHEAKVLRDEAKMAHSVLSNDPDTVAEAKRLLDAHVEELAAKVEAKKVAVAEPGKAKTTLASRRKELSELQAKYREMVKLQKQLAGRAKVTPIATPEERADTAYEREAQQRMERGIALETEGTTGRLRARKLGPMVRPEVTAGNIRTGALETTGQRMLPARNKLTQAGIARGVTGTQAMRAAGKDTAQEHAMLELSRVEDLQERNETALEKAHEAGDKALIAKHEGYSTRLEVAHEKAQRQLDKVTRAAPSVERAGARQSTDLSDTAVEAARDGRITDVAKDIADNGSSPEVRALAAKLQPLLLRTKLKVDEGVVHKGESVAGLYEPETNTATMHPRGLTEEDMLHEMTHAATDRVLLADPATLTSNQRAARTGLEGMQKTLVRHPSFADEKIGDVREFVAEALSNPDFRAKLNALGKPLTLWDHFTNFIRKMFDVPPKTPTSKVEDLIDQILQPSRQVEAAPAPSAHRAAATAVGAFDQELTEHRSKLAQLNANRTKLPLAFEQKLVDMRAALRRTFVMGDKKLGTQAEYALGTADAGLNNLQSVATRGAMGLGKDEKGFTTITAGHSKSAKDVFDAISKIPGKDAAEKMSTFQAGITALHAKDTGWDKLNFKDPERMRTLGEAALKEIYADPAKAAAFDAARGVYRDLNQGLVRFAMETDAIPKELGEQMLADKNYVPFYHENGDSIEMIMPDGHPVAIGDIRSLPIMHALKGGDLKLMPFQDSIFRNIGLLTDLGVRNTASKQIAYHLQALGKESGVMQIKRGKGTMGNGDVLRFRHKPDPNDPHDDGERHIVVDTSGTAAEGIPTDLLAQAVAGSYATMPSFLKAAGWASDLLRAGVTRMPTYWFSQTIKDPFNAAMLGNLKRNPVAAAVETLKLFAGNLKDTSIDANILRAHGVLHSNVFGGGTADLRKIAMQLAGDNQSHMARWMAGLDNMAMTADAATREQHYRDVRNAGGSEVEAVLGAREMQNFNKRGSSATVQMISRMVPFFNAQIQGLNVVAKSAMGKMTTSELLKSKQAFMNRAMGLSAVAVMYAAAMDDDPDWQKMTLRDKLSYIHIPKWLTGTKEALRMPSPFETGMLFYSMPVAFVENLKKGFSPRDWGVVKDVLLNQVPGNGSIMPQIFKGAYDVSRNYNTGTGLPIEPKSVEHLAPQERFDARTSEAAKRMSETLADAGIRLSPMQMDYLANAYMGQLPQLVAVMTNQVFSNEAERGVEPPAGHTSDNPIVGRFFQNDRGRNAVDHVYELATASKEAGDTFNHMIAQGRVADAKAFMADHKKEIVTQSLASKYIAEMAKFKKAEDLIRGLPRMSPEAKQDKIDELAETRRVVAQKYGTAFEAVH